jgi:hypothetical protein
MKYVSKILKFNLYEAVKTATKDINMVDTFGGSLKNKEAFKNNG